MQRLAWCAPLLAPLVAAGVGAAGAGQSATDPHGAGHTYTVTIEGVQFHPEVLAVHRGDRIVWTNKDPFPHTVTAAAKVFDSRALAPEASFTYLASKPGEYAYGCKLHPTMKGKILVQ
jgi:plastocyanin